MSHQIRLERTVDVGVHTVLATAEAIPMADYAGGILHVPTGATTANLTFFVSGEKAGTYTQLYDSAATPAAVAFTGVAASRSYHLPAACGQAAWLKIVTSTGTGTWSITLKS